MRVRAVIRSPAAEVVGYVVLALALGIYLWSRIGDVDGFYLDEWIYVKTGEYLWHNFPGGLVGTIPFWDRGVQRLYSAVLAPFWGTLHTSDAYTITHLLNTALLVSAIAPLALLARRLIDSVPLRLLAVALAIAVPWLTIGSHLLTENLAFPLYMWSFYAIVACAETPSLWRQAGALVALGALGLCRVNLAFVVVVLFVAVAVAEWLRRRDERDVPRGVWFRRALRREALVIAAAAVAAVIGIVLALRGGSGVSGRYAILDFRGVVERLFGESADDTWRTVLTYLRGIVVGSFVFPFAVGAGVAFAGLTGRLGRRFVVPALVAVLSLVVVVVVVATSTVGGSIEERYVMYVYPPLAVLAVAGLPHLRRAGIWLAAGAAVTVYILAEGFGPAFANSGHFFASPGGAFWARVVQHRLVSWEDDLLGWLSIEPKGWLLVAAGLAAMCVFVLLAGRFGRDRMIVPVLAGGLALCAVAQVLELNYDFRQELYGTAEAPGGIAGGPGHDRDRQTWLDDRGSPDSGVAIVPGVAGDGGPWGGTEVEQFWNTPIDATVSLTWDGTVLPVPPGYTIVETRVGPGGVAEWLTRPAWLAAHRDDPRMQFAGSLVAKSPTSRYALYRTRPSMKALWTSTVQPDGAVLRDAPVRMVLNRRAAPGVRAVTITLAAAPGAKRAVRWQVTRAGQVVTGGELRPEHDGEVRLALPACPARGRCGPVRWELAASGPAVPMGLPDYGAIGEPRPVVLHLDAAHVDVRSP